MASKRDLLRLFQAVGASDWSRASAAANAIADYEKKRGHHALSEQLRGSLTTEPPTIVQGDLFGRQGSLAQAPSLPVLTALHAPVRLGDVSLPKKTRQVFEALLEEHRHAETLAAHGVPPRRRVLLHGPPGCGKSMTARAVASELGLPVFVVRLDAIVGSYLGQTASRIRELFRFAETVDCVLLVDEIDALGRTRGDSRDIGELDRVAISLMQELEHADPKGLLIATSNLATSLDPALVRRFDLVEEFRAPSPSELVQFARREGQKRNLRLSAAVVGRVRRSRNFAAAQRLLVDHQRESLLAKLEAR